MSVAEERRHFPRFDVLSQSKFWDEVTGGVVRRRLQPPGPLQFFDADEAAVAEALFDRLLAREDGPEVDVLGVVDGRLAGGAGDGYRYEDMPEDAEAWKRSLAALDADCNAIYGVGFAKADHQDQIRILELVRASKDQWHGLPAARLFSLWMRYACAAFYAHPLVWNEIGFGGPAYPRGYKNIGIDRREPWEVAEADASDPVPLTGGEGR
ncbi:MAG TPA: gluconate 2-dehydrogenase subunit 3 family protein [Acidimicrobiales bacterium]|jgi:hypothetical protein|nr:gluconate 2-dehydrogenase subunit 3 family protein [Acidimicrobiales bacterium]